MTVQPETLASMSLAELRAAIDRLTAEKIALSRDLIKLQSELIRRNRRGGHDVEHQ